MASFQFGNCAVLVMGGVLASGVWAQPQIPTNFETLLQSPDALRRALEYCDGHPDYEVMLANWLMSAHPRSAGDREVIRWGSAHLFTDTESRQVTLGLANALIEVPLQDLNTDPRANPIQLANATSRYLMGELFRLREYPQSGRAKVDAIKIAINLQLIEAPPRQTLFLHTLQQRLGLRSASSTARKSRRNSKTPKSSVGFASRSRAASKNRAAADVPDNTKKQPNNDLKTKGQAELSPPEQFSRLH
jgi:hypothetical protein